MLSEQSVVFYMLLGSLSGEYGVSKASVCPEDTGTDAINSTWTVAEYNQYLKQISCGEPSIELSSLKQSREALPDS